MGGKLEIKPEIVIEAEVKKQVEYRKVGNVLMIRGLTMFTYSPITGIVKKLDTEKKVSIGLDRKIKRETKASHDISLVYIQALNLKNAKRKAAKMLKKAKEENDRRKKNS